jgi:hypothetical protein
VSDGEVADKMKGKKVYEPVLYRYKCDNGELNSLQGN